MEVIIVVLHLFKCFLFTPVLKVCNMLFSDHCWLLCTIILVFSLLFYIIFLIDFLVFSIDWHFSCQCLVYLDLRYGFRFFLNTVQWPRVSYIYLIWFHVVYCALQSLHIWIFSKNKFSFSWRSVIYYFVSRQQCRKQKSGDLFPMLVAALPIC